MFGRVSRTKKAIVAVVSMVLVAAVAVGVTLAVTGGGDESGSKETGNKPQTLTQAEVEDRVETAFLNGRRVMSINSVRCSQQSSTAYRCFVSFIVQGDDGLHSRDFGAESLNVEIDSAGGVRIQGVSPY